MWAVHRPMCWTGWKLQPSIRMDRKTATAPATDIVLNQKSDFVLGKQTDIVTYKGIYMDILMAIRTVIFLPSLLDTYLG
jgi:hypothetical protein